MSRFPVSRTGLSPAVAKFSTLFRYLPSQRRWRSYNPTLCLDTRGVGSCAFARHYWRNRFLLSFPAGNEMFQFPAFAPCLAWCRDRSRRVSPFGNPRVTGYLPLHAAYRSLSRPSSPPRATGIPHAPFFAFFVSFAFYQNLLSVCILLLDSRLFSLRISYDVAILLIIHRRDG